MHFRKAIRNLASPLLAGCVLLSVGACLENPVEPHHHAEPEGMILRLGGTVVVTVDEEGDVNGALTVAAGQDSEVLEITVVDHDGDPIAVDGYYVEVQVIDAGGVEFVQDEPGAFTGRLRGITAGSTAFEFQLMHGSVGSGHLEYRSPPIPVTVTD